VLGATLGGRAALVGVLALLGTPLFAVMGGTSEMAWLSHPEAVYHHLRYIAPTILDERFAGSPILITIPLFTFVGYIMAESKTPDRIVRTARAWLGWLPGGLALVCIVASEFFNVVSTGVTIVAIGGLLYPALRKHQYPEKFSLGLVTIGGSIGFLIPPSLTILIYALVAGLDFNKVFKAGFIPGTIIVVLIYAYSAYTAIKYKGPAREAERARNGALVVGPQVGADDPRPHPRRPRHRSHLARRDGRPSPPSTSSASRCSSTATSRGRTSAASCRRR